MIPGWGRSAGERIGNPLQRVLVQASGSPWAGRKRGFRARLRGGFTVESLGANGLRAGNPRAGTREHVPKQLLQLCDVGRHTPQAPVQEAAKHCQGDGMKAPRSSPVLQGAGQPCARAASPGPALLCGAEKAPYSLGLLEVCGCVCARSCPTLCHPMDCM